MNIHIHFTLYFSNKCLTCGKQFLIDMDFSHHWKKCGKNWIKNAENMRCNSNIEKEILSQSIKSHVIVKENDNIPVPKPLTDFIKPRAIPTPACVIGPTLQSGSPTINACPTIPIEPR